MDGWGLGLVPAADAIQQAKTPFVSSLAQSYPNSTLVTCGEAVGLPDGQIVSPSAQPWDDAFTEVRGTPSVVWEDVARISIESDAPWWVVYTEDPDGICIEPQTAPPDAQNLGITGEHYIEALFVFEEE